MYSIEDFIRKARLVHGDKYDYSKVNYVNSQTKVCIICPIHGEFWQIPAEHLRGKGCVKCGQALCGKKQKDKARETFAKRCEEIHGDKYSYDKVDYVDSHTKIIVTCKKHGDFITVPNRMLNGSGCPKCKSEKAHAQYSKGTLKFIDEARRIHGDLYDYSLSEYYNTHSKVKIICKEHGIFEIAAGTLLSGSGCPLCKEPMGEQKIRLYLEKKRVLFIRQYAIEYNGNKYRCDFYVPSKNLIIEYNGMQHYKPVERFGGAKKFRAQKQRDRDVRDYCKRNNIKLLEITYLQYEIIEQILDIIFSD